MKAYLTFAASLAVLALAACTPAPGSSDSASADSASVADIVTGPSTPAVASLPVEEDSVAASAASVVVQTTEVYDTAVIHQIAARPGYWQVAHTDPDTHKRVVTKVCIDRDLGGHMSGWTPPSPPAGHRDDKPDASFLGACPGAMHGGDVVAGNGHKVNAWGDHRDDHGAPSGGDHHESSSSAGNRDNHGNPPTDNGRPQGHGPDHAHDASSSPVIGGTRPDDHLHDHGGADSSSSSRSRHGG